MKNAILTGLLIGVALGAASAQQPDQPRGLSTPAAASSEPLPPGRDLALLFATDVYRDPGWPPLQNPVRDATTIAQELRDAFGFEVDLVPNPSLAQIDAKLREYVDQRRLAPSDRLFVFFAGHGVYDQTLDLGFIVASDSRSGRDVEARRTYLSFSDLYRYLQRVPVGHLFVVLDVCHGGTFGDVMRGGTPTIYEAPSPEARVAAAAQRPSRKFLTSGGNEYVPDGRPGSHSPFAFRFIEALRSHPDDGIVSALGIIDHVRRIQPNQPAWGDMPGSSPGSDFLFVGPELRAAMRARAPATSGGVGTGGTSPARAAEVRAEMAPGLSFSAQATGADDLAIRQVLLDYKTAMERRDRRRVREIYPAVDRATLDRFFADVESLTMNLSCGAVMVVPVGRAHVDCTVGNAVRYRRQEAVAPAPFPQRVHFVRVKGAWAIERLEVR